MIEKFSREKKKGAKIMNRETIERVKERAGGSAAVVVVVVGEDEIERVAAVEAVEETMSLREVNRAYDVAVMVVGVEEIETVEESVFDKVKARGGANGGASGGGVAVVISASVGRVGASMVAKCMYLAGGNVVVEGVEGVEGDSLELAERERLEYVINKWR